MSVHAETLRQALLSTYKSNPRLNAQRENLRATDASVAIARAQSRPQVSATAGLNRDLIRSGQFGPGIPKGPIVSGGLDLSLPLFEGGRVRNGIKAAQVRVQAGRAALRAVEGEVFTAAVGAYMDVIRDRAVVDLNENQVRVLATNLEGTRSLYKGGDLTLTDIAQSRARLNLADSQLAEAQAQLTTSEETYRSLTGHMPDNLTPPPPLPHLPASADEAIHIALDQNPQILAARLQARASGLDVDVARADRLPTISGVVSGSYLNTIAGDNLGRPLSGTSGGFGVSSRIPLYQGGLPTARIRQAQAFEGQLQEQLVESQRLIVATAGSAFATYAAAQRSIRSNEEAVSANELAVEGARAERGVGTRTVIEVLNAEQELLVSRVQLITARRNAYVAGFQLLNAMGEAQAEELGLDGGPLYDPVDNYRRVAGTVSDWAEEGRHEVRSTPTTAEPVLSGSGVVSMQRSSTLSATDEAWRSNSSLVDRTGARDVYIVPSINLLPDKKVKTEPKRAGVRQPVYQSAGPWQIQLGAFRVTSAPQKLFASFAGQLVGKQPTYEQVGNVIRLLVGTYATENEARAACKSLKFRSDCFALRSP